MGMWQEPTLKPSCNKFTHLLIAFIYHQLYTSYMLHPSSEYQFCLASWLNFPPSTIFIQDPPQSTVGWLAKEDNCDGLGLGIGPASTSSRQLHLTFDVLTFHLPIAFSTAWLPLQDLRGWNIGLRVTTWRAPHLFGGKQHRSIVLMSLCSSPQAIIQSFFSSMHPCGIISYALRGLC
jgi:hypothetical protein